MDGKLKFSAQGSNLAHCVGNWTKIKIPSEIKPPLNVFDTCLLKGLTEVKDARIRKLMAWLRNALSLKFSKSSSIHCPRPIVTYDKLIIVSWSKWRQLGGSFFKTFFNQLFQLLTKFLEIYGVLVFFPLDRIAHLWSKHLICIRSPTNCTIAKDAWVGVQFCINFDHLLFWNSII